ncbi:translation initiation factor IF-2 [candidate division KSB1 bacterium]|nr:MAG: translation initiation factor IF-2 [candidate division KSB1 bacterium]
MSFVPAEKQKKIYQVAKELNVATPAIVEFLEDRGFDVPKKHMSALTEDMYVEVIKKFDPLRWQRQLEEESRVLDDARRAEAERARAEQSMKILDEIATQASEATETLMRQVQEQKSERARKAQTQAEQEEAARIAEENRIAEEAEKVRKLAEEKERKESERKEAEQRETERKEAERKRREETPKQPEIQRTRRPVSRDEGPRPPARPYERPAGGRPGGRPGERPPRAGGPERPQRPGGQQERPSRPGGPERPPRPGGPERPQRPGGPPRPMPPKPAIGVKPKDPTRKRPTKEDIEALEKQKKLLAAQKADKYKKVSVAGEFEAPARRKQRRKKVDQKEVAATIKQTLASMDTGKKRHRRREKGADVALEDDTKLRLTEYVTNQELANLMGVEVSEVIAKFLSMGKLVSINQRLERDLIELVADEFGFQVEFVSDREEELPEAEEADKPEDLVARPPVVTVMGHVDHGKTSLLDHLRKTTVIASESGGITQHIGAYEVTYKGRSITFLDTPGHEAFTAMRARGAQTTDIVILVVAADDQVRPQTIEAINHAQSAGVPIVVAINKIDKPNADPERVRQQLAEANVLVEQWGGKIQSAEISAKFGQGMDNLLEEVLLVADILELKANPNRAARGTVIESRLDKGRGILATLLITNGTLKVGDNFVAGQQYGKVRSLFDEWGHAVEDAKPGEPVQVVGFSGAPQAGDTFIVFENEREVKEIAMRRQLLQREQTFRQIHAMSLDQISQQIREGGLRELSLIIKGDADGSVEAICDTLQRISTSEVAVKIVHRGVGAISESDVLLASATGAIILGFHVHPNIKARELATREQVDIRVYRVIYEMEDDIRNALEGLLAPDTREDVVGLVEIRELFIIPKIGTIAGSFVVSGKIMRTSQVRLLRDGREVWRGKLSSLRRFKDDAREVRAGFDCGIGLDSNIEIKVNDTLEVFEVVEVKRKLEQTSA